MSARDRMALMIIVAGVMLAGMWFVLVSPERQKAAQAATALAQAQSQRDLAVANENAAEQAKLKFNDNVSTLSQLNKAVPANQNVAALLAQLEATAQSQGVNFVSITNAATGPGAPGGGGAPSVAASSPAPTASVGPTPTANAAVSKANASSSATANANPGGTPASPAGAPASAPASASSFPSQGYTLSLTSDYPHLQNFLYDINHWTSVNRGQVSVSGPLLSIQSVKVSTSGTSGPSATVNISVYSSPQSGTSPAALLAQLQASATAPIARPPATAATRTPAPAGHPLVAPAAVPAHPAAAPHPTAVVAHPAKPRAKPAARVARSSVPAGAKR